MADGPLIVQSDRTVLLEVAHPDAETARHELAIFAELERAPEHIHTYRITRLGLWNARAAGHDADDMLGDARPMDALPGAAVGLDRHPRDRRPLRPARHRARHVDGTATARSCSARRMPRCWPKSRTNKRIQPLLIGHPSPDTFVVDAWARGHIKQELLKIGWPAEDLAGYTPGTPHPIELAEGELAPAAVSAPGRRHLHRGRLGRRRAPLRRRQDARRRGRDGRDEDHDAHPRHQHRERPAVARRAAQAHVPHRRGDRRVLRPGEGDQAGHDRDLPDPHGEAEGRVRAPRAARRPRLGPHRLRRGAPAARAGLQAHRRPAGPTPAGPHRHARARGRPRGRRLQPHRPQALRRAVEGDRGPGLHLPRGLLRGARRPARRRPARVRGGRRRRALPARRDRAREDRRRPTARRAARRRAHPRDRAVPRPDRRARRGARRPEDHRRDARR